MNVKRLLAILPKNSMITVKTEFGKQLFFGKVYELALSNKNYILSLLVVDVYQSITPVIIVVN